MALMQKPQRLKRSVVVSGRRTAISLEDAFADGLREIAAERGVTMSALVSMIDTSRTQSNLSRGNGPKLETFLKDLDNAFSARRRLQVHPISRSRRPVPFLEYSGETRS